MCLNTAASEIEKVLHNTTRLHSEVYKTNFNVTSLVVMDLNLLYTSFQFKLASDKYLDNTLV